MNICAVLYCFGSCVAEFSPDCLRENEDMGGLFVKFNYLPSGGLKGKASSSDHLTGIKGPPYSDSSLHPKEAANQ